MAARRRLILKQKLALGDAVLMTALARDVALTYPGYFDILADTSFSEVWDHCPFARKLPRQTTFTDGLPVKVVQVNYKAGIIAAGRGEQVHMLAWYHRDFAKQTGMALVPTAAKACLNLAPDERPPAGLPARYWVLVAGGKTDVTVKIWDPARWQRVIDLMAERGITVVQAGARHEGHVQPTLRGVIDLVGKTKSSRELFALIAGADGVLCGITAAMHIAAAFDKPCVVVAGGREEPAWESYTQAYGAFGPKAAVKVEHRFLHTLGLLDCCRRKGCWKHRVEPIGYGQQNERYNGQLCRLPVTGESVAKVPRCMELVTADHVLESVMSYYGKEIPPVSPVKPNISGNVATTLLSAKTIAELQKMEATSKAIAEAVKNGWADKPLTPPDGTAVAGDPLKFDTGASPRVVTAGGSATVIHDEVADFDADRFRRLMYNEPSNRPQRPKLIDHPLIGGRFTVCVLCYGDYENLARSCIGSILATLPADCIDLRVGMNAVCEGTRRYVQSLNPTAVYDHPENAKKYPVLREMLHDPARPISSPWLVWFDDDAKIVDGSMWSKLCGEIVANYPHGVRMFGNLFLHDTRMFARNGMQDPLKWFRDATWWRGQHFRVRGRNMAAPNGSVIEFASGWFWALSRDAIYAADIPDRRLNHNGGDACIGAQVQQAGFRSKAFNNSKSLVWCPPKEAGGRRGFSEPFPWSK